MPHRVVKYLHSTEMDVDDVNNCVQISPAVSILYFQSRQFLLIKHKFVTRHFNTS